jgi:hypothetical protein
MTAAFDLAELIQREPILPFPFLPRPPSFVYSGKNTHVSVSFFLFCVLPKACVQPYCMNAHNPLVAYPIRINRDLQEQEVIYVVFSLSQTSVLNNIVGHY